MLNERNRYTRNHIVCIHLQPYNNFSADPHPHLLRGVMLLRHAVDHNAHHLRWNKLQDGNNDQQGNCAKIAAPLPAEVPAELSK
mgnify:CR=1 FL=1